MSEHKFKKGDWIRKIAGRNFDIPEGYYQVSSISSMGSLYVRPAGSAGRGRRLILSKHVECFEPAKLRPDFRDAKAGDKAFCVVFGYVEIDDISGVEYETDYPVTVDAPPGAEIYQIDGRYQPYAEHPSLFWDHYQAKAYFAEAFRLLDEEVEDGN